MSIFMHLQGKKELVLVYLLTDPLIVALWKYGETMVF